MKNSLFLTAALLALCQSASATPNRVHALGSSAVMVPDDDTNIDLFPQTMNRFNFLRLSRIDSSLPDYAILMGESGDKWGLYGGNSELEDFLNVYHSMNDRTAIKLGIRTGHEQVRVSTNNNESIATTTEKKNTYNDLGVNAVLGTNMGEREIAANIFFASGPASIDALMNKGNDELFGRDFGTYEETKIVGTTLTKSMGDAKTRAVGGSLSIRQPFAVAMFRNAFVSGGFGYQSKRSFLAVDNKPSEDYSDSSIQMHGSILLFGEKPVAENSRLFYGLGCAGSLQRFRGESKTTSEAATQWTLNVTAPLIRLGVESDIFYGKLRFGISRQLNLINYMRTRSTPNTGLVNDSEEGNVLAIASNGSYTFGAGYGIAFKNLKIDLTLDNDIWVRGPQKIFDTQAGPIAASADVIYMFN